MSLAPFIEPIKFSLKMSEILFGFRIKYVHIVSYRILINFRWKATTLCIIYWHKLCFFCISLQVLLKFSVHYEIFYIGSTPFMFHINIITWTKQPLISPKMGKKPHNTVILNKITLKYFICESQFVAACTAGVKWNKIFAQK